VLTAVLMPRGTTPINSVRSCLTITTCRSAPACRKSRARCFRIGHLGECNELTLLGALTGVEMGLSVAGVPHRAGAVTAAMNCLEGRAETTILRLSE